MLLLLLLFSLLLGGTAHEGQSYSSYRHAYTRGHTGRSDNELYFDTSASTPKASASSKAGAGAERSAIDEDDLRFSEDDVDNDEEFGDELYLDTAQSGNSSTTGGGGGACGALGSTSRGKAAPSRGGIGLMEDDDDLSSVLSRATPTPNNSMYNLTVTNTSTTNTATDGRAYSPSMFHSAFDNASANGGGGGDCSSRDGNNSLGGGSSSSPSLVNGFVNAGPYLLTPAVVAVEDGKTVEGLMKNLEEQERLFVKKLIDSKVDMAVAKDSYLTRFQGRLAAPAFMTDPKDVHAVLEAAKTDNFQGAAAVAAANKKAESSAHSKRLLDPSANGGGSTTHTQANEARKQLYKRSLKGFNTIGYVDNRSLPYTVHWRAKLQEYLSTIDNASTLLKLLSTMKRRSPQAFSLEEMICALAEVVKSLNNVTVNKLNDRIY